MSKFLIKQPLVTEKSTAMSAGRKYLFLVDAHATKPEVKKAVKSAYKVDALTVRIINVKPKKKRLGRNVGMKEGYKKAIVTLKEGQKLDILPTA